MKITNSKHSNRFFDSIKDNDTLVLALYDAIGADFFGGGITAANIQAALDEGNYSAITLRVNSPGGDAFEGVTITNLLKSSGKPVNVIVDGLAASAASIICMAGDTVTMNDGSVMMIHEAQGFAMGDADEMRKLADTLDTVTESIADIYVAKTGLAKNTVLNLMADETWMNASEAKSKGFATAVSKDKAQVTNVFDLSVFKNAPRMSNAAKTKEVAGEHLTAGDFVYVGNPDDTSTWSLPWHFSTEEKTKSHLRDALARFDQDKVIPKAHKPEAYAKLVRLCKQHGIEVSDDKDNASDFQIELLRRQLEINKRK